MATSASMAAIPKPGSRMAEQLAFSFLGLRLSGTPASGMSSPTALVRKGKGKENSTENEGLKRARSAAEHRHRRRRRRHRPALLWSPAIHRVGVAICPCALQASTSSLHSTTTLLAGPQLQIYRPVYCHHRQLRAPATFLAMYVYCTIKAGGHACTIQ